MAHERAPAHWGEAVQCDALDPAGNRCVLQDGHSQAHLASAPRPRHQALVGVLSLMVLIAAGVVNLFLLVVAYYGLGGARATPDAPWIEMIWIGFLALGLGVVLNADRRTRPALVCAAALLLLELPVGLVTFTASESGPSGDVVADASFVLLFAIPGLLLLGLVAVTRRLRGPAQPATAPPR